MLAPLVAKVELHFDHERHGKLERNPFRHGTIFVRPTEPQLSLLFRKFCSFLLMWRNIFTSVVPPSTSNRSKTLMRS